VISQLFKFLLVAVAGWLISRVIRGAVRPAAPGRAQPRREVAGEMVRDRVCNTFLPRSSALVERVGGETHYFCSEGCRLRFLGGRTAATAGGSGSTTSS
jgi:YHS domain-containing protein